MRTSSFIISLSLLASFCFASPIHAATPLPGGLIKGPGDAVYYYAQNAKRYVFPTLNTFTSWYANFDSLTSLSSLELQNIPLGGNVTYRPGVRLVKITTDPKVYAVAAHGVLRWVTSEAIATALYGVDWNTKVDDIPDAYFTNYSIGADISNATQYIASQETANATSIFVDKNVIMDQVTLVATSTPSTSPTAVTSTSSSLSFVASKPSPRAGDVIALTAQIQDNSVVTAIEIFFDGSLVTTCYSPSCSGEIAIPLSGTKANYVAEARAHRVNNQVVIKSLTLPIESGVSSLLQIKLGQPTIMQNQLASIVTDADISLAVVRIDIYVDGYSVKACATGARQCQWSDYVAGNIGSVHPVYSKVTDTLGRTYLSKTLSLTIGNNDAPGVTVTPVKNTIYAGEFVDITVSATDSDGIASIDVMKDGTILKHCLGAQPCTATTGPWQNVGTLHFTGQATDSKGTTAPGDAMTVSVMST